MATKTSGIGGALTVTKALELLVLVFFLRSFLDKEFAMRLNGMKAHMIGSPDGSPKLNSGRWRELRRTISAIGSFQKSVSVIGGSNLPRILQARCQPRLPPTQGLPSPLGKGEGSYMGTPRHRPLQSAQG